MDCKQERESENIVNMLSLEDFIYSNASCMAFASAVNIVASFGRRVEKTLLSITAADATVSLSFEPSV